MTDGRAMAGGPEAAAGTLADLQTAGQLRTKVGSLPVVVFWHDGAAYAIEDRCPHLGFPLHQGTVEAGLVTCHWHHARFDLVSGCTLDLWADDARGFDVEVARRRRRSCGRGRSPMWSATCSAACATGSRRTSPSSIAKSVLGLLDAGVAPGEIVRTGVEFGTRYRDAGLGRGLTTLSRWRTCSPISTDDDRALALVHGLAVRRATTRAAARRGSRSGR